MEKEIQVKHKEEHVRGSTCFVKSISRLMCEESIKLVTIKNSVSHSVQLRYQYVWIKAEAIVGLHGRKLLLYCLAAGVHA